KTLPVKGVVPFLEVFFYRRDIKRANFSAKIFCPFFIMDILAKCDSSCGILSRRQIIRIRSRICRLEPFSRQMCSNLNRICRLELTLRQMCSVLSKICRLEPASRQMCSNLNRICHLERLCPYNCVKEKSHSHPHDTIILDQQNFVGGNENDSTQFYLKLRRTKRTNY